MAWRHLVVALGVIGSTSRADAQVPTAYRLVDLSHPISATMPAWPGSKTAFRLDTIFASATGAMNNWFTPEHLGTHLDAPRHASGTGATTDRVPLEQLIAPARVVDVRASVAGNADYRVTASDIEAHERPNGPIQAGTFVVIRTGWAERWGTPSYFGAKQEGDKTVLHFPSLGVDAARLLVSRRVAAIAVDAASTDYGAAASFDVHGILGAAGIPAIENLVDPREVPVVGAILIALTPKVVGGSGGPVRVVAMIPR